MALDNVVRGIIDDSDPKALYVRAIRLFEFQVAIFHRRSFEKLMAADDPIRAPTRMLRSARIFVAIKLLEKIERDWKHERSANFISIRELANHDEYRTLFDEVIARNGGWPRIRHTLSVGDFDEHIEARRDEARVVANIIDFSFRFSIFGAQHTIHGGVNNARHVVEKAATYRTSIGETRIKTRWRQYKRSSIFLYLLLVHRFALKPPRVGSKKFIAKLLDQISNTDQLREFFRAYQVVRSKLIAQGYKDLPTLNLDLGAQGPALEVSDFQSDIKSAIEALKL